MCITEKIGVAVIAVSLEAGSRKILFATGLIPQKTHES
jgi:hypothetical protein